VTTVNCAL